MAMLLRYFNFEIDDPDYSLQIASTLTVKPKNFYMKAEPRARWTAGAIERDVLGATAPSAPSLQPVCTPFQSIARYSLTEHFSAAPTNRQWHSNAERMATSEHSVRKQ